MAPAWAIRAVGGSVLKRAALILVVLSLLSVASMVRVSHTTTLLGASPLATTDGASHQRSSSRDPAGHSAPHASVATPGGGARTPKINRTLRKGGRDGMDHSHIGLQPDPEDGMLHAWAPVGPRCFGATSQVSCIDAEAVEWFRQHVLFSIITGAEGAFRVEVSQCTWLSHFPPENVFVFSDLIPLPGKNRTPHEWVRGELPNTVYEAHGDIFSPHVKSGYVKVVRKRGQGYSASWIVAQFRFAQALEHMQRVAEHAAASSTASSYKWFIIGDDDTILQLPNLVKRLRAIDVSQPYYLSRKGWGGAGHIYSKAAMERIMAVLPQCVDRYFVRSFRASDDMLLKCAAMAKLHTQMEDTMSHCPASHLGRDNLLSTRQVSFHGKKDFYPPILLTTWRVALYYYASYCKNAKAAELATFYSACAFGSCKQHGCTKEKNAEMLRQWKKVSHNGTVAVLPFEAQGIAFGPDG